MVNEDERRHPDSAEVADAEQGSGLFLYSWLFWSLCILGGLAVIGVCAYLYLTWRWKSAFYREIDRLKEDGVPYSAASLQEAYRERQPEQMKIRDRSRAEWVPEAIHDIQTTVDVLSPGEKWLHVSPEKRAKRGRAILEILRDRREELTGLLLKRYRPARLTFSEGPRMDLPHVKDRIIESRVLFLYARARIETGSPAEAVPFIRKMYEMGRITRKEPVMLSNLVGMVLTTHASNAVAHMLRQPDLPPAVKQVIGPTRPSTLKSDFLFALDGERVHMGIVLLRGMMEDGTFKGYRSRSRRFTPPSLLWLPAVSVLRDFRTLQQLAKKPYPRIKTTIERFLSRRTDSDSYVWRFRNLYSSMLLPSVQSSLKEMYRTKAKLELVRLGLQARIRARETGSTVRSALKTGGTTDPFSGEPYRVREEETSIVLYSVGPDLEDDGGRIVAGEDEHTPRDVGVRIRR